MFAVFLGPVGEAVNYTVTNIYGYNLFSGLVGDLLSLGVIASLVTGIVRHWKRHECHVKGCHRVIWKTVPGTGHEVCKKHHPHEELTHEEILQEHQNYKEEKLT